MSTPLLNDLMIVFAIIGFYKTMSWLLHCVLDRVTRLPKEPPEAWQRPLFVQDLPRPSDIVTTGQTITHQRPQPTQTPPMSSIPWLSRIAHNANYSAIQRPFGGRSDIPND